MVIVITSNSDSDIPGVRSVDRGRQNERARGNFHRESRNGALIVGRAGRVGP